MKFEEFCSEVKKLTTSTKRSANFDVRLSGLCNAANEIFSMLNADKVAFPSIEVLHRFQQSLLMLRWVAKHEPKFLSAVEPILNKTNILKNETINCLRREINTCMQEADEADVETAKELHLAALHLCELIPSIDLQISDMQILGNLYCFKANAEFNDNLGLAIKSYIRAQEFFKAIVSQSDNPGAVYYYLSENLELLADSVKRTSNMAIRANAKYLLEKYLLVFPNDINATRYLLDVMPKDSYRLYSATGERLASPIISVNITPTP